MTATATTTCARPSASTRQLLQTSAGRRYTVAIAVDALGGGLIRPFLVVYAVAVAHVRAETAGAWLSAGLGAGLVVVPLVGRWLDSGGRATVAAATLGVRAAGLLALVTVGGTRGFAIAAVLTGVGTQAWPVAHAGVVTALTTGASRDVALALTRSVRNAGLGAGAATASLLATRGNSALRPAVVTAAGMYAVAAALVVHAGITLCTPADSGARGAPPASRYDPPSRGLGVLCIGNVAYGLCFDVLEVALPLVVIGRLHAAASWSSAIFVLNTVLVIAAQVALVGRMSSWPRAGTLVASGGVLAASYLMFWAASVAPGNDGAAALLAVSVVYTLGEMLYAGSGTALVVAATPPATLGRALARWQLSTGVGRAVAPVLLTTLLARGAGTLWLSVAVLTAAAAGVIARWGPRDAGQVSDMPPGSAAVR